MLLEVGEAWTTMDIRSGIKIDLLWTARFLIRHCLIGAFALPWYIENGWNLHCVGANSLDIICCGVVEGGLRRDGACC